jgi:YfiH family protein
MDFLKANWQAPSFVHAYTTRQHPHSATNFNLADHVNDDPNVVLANREKVKSIFSFSKEPAWLNQTHSIDCVEVDISNQRHADAAITRSIHQPLVILTADCLPILICHRYQTEIAAVHAGWRGLYDGIIQNTIQKLNDKPENYMAWIGPAICGNCYQVGPELYEKFTSKYDQSEICFHQEEAHFKFHLNHMAEKILVQHGISNIFQSNNCTYEDPLFYSYRRQPQTGRIATFIWLEEN